MEPQRGEEVITLSIIEDHAIVRAGLRMLIENQPDMEVIWEASNGREALAENRERPHVILLDLDLGDQNGVDLLPTFLDRFDASRVLVLTAASDRRMHLAAVAAGATGIVVKEQAPETLLKAIHRVHDGEAWLDRALLSEALGQTSRPDSKKNLEAAKIALLTPREREIVGLVGEGFNGERMAEHLGISEATVRNHLTSILGKLQLSNKFELAVYAMHHGLRSG